MVRSSLLLFTAALFPLPLCAASDAVDFVRDVQPVLEVKCLSCHNPNNSKGALSLASWEDLKAFGPELLIPGNSLDSLLHQVVIPLDEGDEPEMPKKGDPFTPREADALAAWIDAGAEWPEGLTLREASKTDKSWWSYLPLNPGPPPSIPPKAPSQWRSNPIDAYILNALHEKGITPNPAASRRDLIRRATYDLTGLPPTPEEVAAFEADTRPDAYERLIDRLLASPHYGERWGRHWLDVVRFGESTGYERNGIISNAWPFRDYVIRSLNEDKPFDQLIREHLAGDVIGEGQPALEIGSAFLVAGPYDDVRNQDPVQQAQIRANTMDEIINATGEAFLAMTLGCARCHDHKFDPITSEDYYGLYATFSAIRHDDRVLATPEERRKHQNRLAPLRDREASLLTERRQLTASILERAEADAAKHAAEWTRPKVDRTGTEERFAPRKAKFVRLLVEAEDIDPSDAKGWRIDEFEIWSAGSAPQNVALASRGATARGESRTVEDFPGAYAAKLAIDGRFGARFISDADYLEIELARPVEIVRVFFSSARDQRAPQHPKFRFVAEYRIETSMDGQSWSRIASSHDRRPASPAHRRERLLKLETTESERKRLDALSSEIASVQTEIRQVPNLPKVWAGVRNPSDAEGPFHVFLGGSPQKKGPEVVPASLSALSEVTPTYRLPADAPESRRRLELAEWMTHPENPLPPRVLANRLWQYHFGTGIVDTPNDFGYMGGKPTHPELLDFLAVQLLENGWRLKAIHRLIMTSQAYRQSAEWRPGPARIDGDSRLLWRFPPRRLSAEEVRDTILQVAGKLDTRMGGPGFRLYKYIKDNVASYLPLDEHGPETYRRAVYHQNARASRIDLMTDFDQPDCAFSAPKRAETTTPLQALTLLNHSFTIDMAEALAERLQKEAPGDAVAQIRRAFHLAYQRDPSAEELRAIQPVVESEDLRAFTRALLNTSELLHVE